MPHHHPVSAGELQSAPRDAAEHQKGPEEDRDLDILVRETEFRSCLTMLNSKMVDHEDASGCGARSVTNLPANLGSSLQ